MGLKINQHNLVELTNILKLNISNNQNSLVVNVLVKSNYSSNSLWAFFFNAEGFLDGAALIIELVFSFKSLFFISQYLLFSVHTCTCKI